MADSMSKVVVVMSVSVDGFIAGPDGELDWQLVDEELHTHFNEVLRDMGAFLHGRVMYELMADFWPTADSDPASPPAESAAWASVVRDVVPSEVEALKAQADGDLALGGADIAAAFRAHDLVDEYRLYVHPVRVGRGKPMFVSPGERQDLHLEETRRFGSGVVLLRYRC